MPGPDTTLPECSGDEGEGFCVEDQQSAAQDIAAYVGRVAGTGLTAEKPTDGKSIFTANCSSCHTLADAGTTGNVGPNLDEAKPPKALVVQRVTNGQGQMPSFKDSLDPAQIEAVAEVRLLRRGQVARRERGPPLGRRALEIDHDVRDRCVVALLHRLRRLPARASWTGPPDGWRSRSRPGGTFSLHPRSQRADRGRRRCRSPRSRPSRDARSSCRAASGRRRALRPRPRSRS